MASQFYSLSAPLKNQQPYNFSDLQGKVVLCAGVSAPGPRRLNAP
jgi:hypothetical protein